MPKGIISSAVPLPCSFDVGEVSEGGSRAGQWPRKGMKSCRTGRNSHPSPPVPTPPKGSEGKPEGFFGSDWLFYFPGFSIFLAMVSLSRVVDLSTCIFHPILLEILFLHGSSRKKRDAMLKRSYVIAQFQLSCSKNLGVALGAFTLHRENREFTYAA